MKYYFTFLLLPFLFFSKPKSFFFNQESPILIQDTLDLKLRPFKEKVYASYYSDKLNGRKTASGQIFDNKKLTVAHKTLKFGTKLKVTNITNNKWVIVQVNDRGPFSKTRELDLSKRAFMEITNNKNLGQLLVNVEIIME